MLKPKSSHTRQGLLVFELTTLFIYKQTIAILNHLNHKSNYIDALGNNGRVSEPLNFNQKHFPVIKNMINLLFDQNEQLKFRNQYFIQV